MERQPLPGFYFAWLAGLSSEATAWVEGNLASAVLAPVLAVADDRKRTNDERWPFYEQFVEVLLTQLAAASARRGGKVEDGSSSLLQLVDVHNSLGCRGEEIFADVRGLDRLAVTYAAELAEPLAGHAKRLTELGVEFGVARKPAQLVPVAPR